MENASISTPEVSASTPAAPPVEVQAAPTPVPAENGGMFDSILKPKMNVKDLVLTGLLVAFSVYGIWYYRTKLKKIKEDPTADEFDDLRADVDELLINVKKALGKNYKTT